jgi:transcriptional regulator with XRE-family HTH domain
MAKDIKNRSLGVYIRDRRVSRNLSIYDAADISGLHPSYWSKLETGQYEAPSPKHLQVIARTLDVDIEDMYSLAGYDIPERLPTFKPYLRAKYDLPPEAIADLERYFDLLRSHFGIPKDKPVFPPKSKKSAKPGNGDQKQRAA